MIVNGAGLSPDERLVADICIVGGGPAGITLALELDRAGLEPGIKIILVESGETAPRKEADALDDADGEPHDDEQGQAPLGLYRRRILGGASSIWGGRCVPLDPIDFEKREHVPASGWPIGYDEVASRYPRAMEYCEAGEAQFDATSALARHTPFIDGFSSDDVLTSSLERFSPPTHFGRKYGPALRSSANIVVLTGTVCTELVSDAAGAVSTASCRAADGRSLEIQAARFVVAAGGLESYRLLASSRTAEGCSPGDAGGVLGRCLMSHLEGTFGKLVVQRPSRAVTWGFERSRDGIYGRRRLSIAPQAQRRHRTLNFIARLHHDLVADPRHRHPVLSAMFVAKNLLLPEYRRKLAMVDRVTAAAMPKGAAFWSAHFRNLLLGAPQLAGFSAGWFWRRHLVYRRIPYVALESRTGVYPLDLNQEQSPDRDNRVFLRDARDRFGMRQIGLQWRATDLDYASIAGNCRILRDAFAGSRVARFEFDDATLEDDVRRCVPIGGHHIGMTRMAASADDGVVDRDCKVFGTSNLYVASAAVFPTSGHANPTLTIVALAVRLADHLRQQRRGGSR